MVPVVILGLQVVMSTCKYVISININMVKYVLTSCHTGDGKARQHSHGHKSLDTNFLCHGSSRGAAVKPPDLVTQPRVLK